MVEISKESRESISEDERKNIRTTLERLREKLNPEAKLLPGENIGDRKTQAQNLMSHFYNWVDQRANSSTSHAEYIDATKDIVREVFVFEGGISVVGMALCFGLDRLKK